MRTKKCRVFVKGVERCDAEVVERVCWHDDGYENKKYVSVCKRHAQMIRAGKYHLNW